MQTVELTTIINPMLVTVRSGFSERLGGCIIKEPVKNMIPYGMMFVNGGKLWGCGKTRYNTNLEISESIIPYPMEIPLDGAIAESVIFGPFGYFVTTDRGIFQVGDRYSMRSDHVPNHSTFIENQSIRLPVKDGRRITHISVLDHNVAMCDDYGKAWGMMKGSQYDHIDEFPIIIGYSERIQMVSCSIRFIFMLDDGGHVFYIFCNSPLRDMCLGPLNQFEAQGMKCVASLPAGVNILSIKSTQRSTFLLDNQGEIWRYKTEYFTDNVWSEEPKFELLLKDGHPLRDKETGKSDVVEIHASSRHLWAKTSKGKWYTEFSYTGWPGILYHIPALDNHRFLSLSNYCIWLINANDEIVSWGQNVDLGLGLGLNLDISDNLRSDVDFVISEEPAVVPGIIYMAKVNRVKRSLQSSEIQLTKRRKMDQNDDDNITSECSC